MSNDFKIWFFGTMLGGVLLMILLINMITEYTIKNENNNITFIISSGCEDNMCITYGGKCINAEDSYVITEGTNVREGCKNDGFKEEYK